MNDIRRVLRVAAWRLGAINFIKALVVLLAAALGLAIALRFAEQLFSFTALAADEGLTTARLWTLYAYWASGACVVLAVAWAVFARPRTVAVARRVDEGANLREALSTALCVAQEQDPWSQATVQSASERARSVKVRQAVPITAPRFWPVPLALALSLAVVFLAVPRMDVLGWYQQAVAAQETQANIEAAKMDVADEKMEKIQDMAKQLGLDPAQPEALPPETPEPQSPEEIRRAAIKELTKLSDRLEQLKTGENAQKLETLQKQLKQVRNPGPETTDLSKALAKGDFEKAQAEIEKMMQKAASSEMSEADKQAMAEQLEKLAQELAKAAENKKELEQKLQEAGLDSQLASNPEALKEALEKAENLSQEQKEKLSEMCEACQNASEAGQGMSKAMSEMAQAMQSGDQSQMSEAAQGLQEQLSELEQIAQEMQMADAAMQECKSKMGQLAGQCKSPGQGEGEGQGSGMEGTSDWAAGWNESEGSGSGGPGQGRGGSPGEARADFDTKKDKNVGSIGDGPIVSSRLVEGESVRGESRAEFVRVLTAAEQSATEAMDEDHTIPREYHEAIKAYFGTLKKKGSGPADRPGEAAKDADKAEPKEEKKDDKK